MPQVKSLAGNLKSAVKPKRKGPLWEGPCGNGPQGGVTQGLLGRYLSCKERYRIHVIEGLAARETFRAPLEFGNMWHAMEEGLAERPNADYFTILTGYCSDLLKRFPMQREEINLWFIKAQVLFPIYVDHWAKHPDVKDRTPLLQEQTFDAPYRLPSGRTVRLRGKWDSVDLIGKDKDARIYLQENKTKSELNPQKVARQMRFDLQTQLYLIALSECQRQNKTWKTEGPEWKNPIGGVRYNVVRRSAHKEKYVQNDLADAARSYPDEWFARWKVEISAADVEKFRRTCLDPALENLCDDYEWWAWCARTQSDPFQVGRFPVSRTLRMDEESFGPAGRHFRLPFGVYNVIAEGGESDLDEYLESGSEVGLRRIDNLFPELS